MKETVVGIMVFVIIYMALLIGASFFLVTSFSKLWSATADVQKCERLSGMGFFECSNLSPDKLNAIIGTSTAQ